MPGTEEALGINFTLPHLPPHVLKICQAASFVVVGDDPTCCAVDLQTPDSAEDPPTMQSGGLAARQLKNTGLGNRDDIGVQFRLTSSSLKRACVSGRPLGR